MNCTYMWQPQVENVHYSILDLPLVYFGISGLNFVHLADTDNRI